MHSLPIFLRLTGRPVMLIGDGPVADAKRRLLERAGARIVGEESAASLAIIVADDEAVARLRARGMLVNVADQPELCDFTLPAIVDRDPVLIAIGTGGASAGLAAALRQRLEALLPAGLGGLAAALHAARPALRARFPDADARRRALAGWLSEGGMLDPLLATGQPADAIAAGASASSDVVRLVISSPDPDDLTLRAARLIGQADRIHHPGDMPPAILDRGRADAGRFVGPVHTPPPAGLTVELRWA